MSFLDVSRLGYTLADGRTLFDDVSFRVGKGQKVALIGANGTGKTTLLRILAGELPSGHGSVRITGKFGYMSQFIGSIRDETSVRRLIASFDVPAVQAASTTLERAEDAMLEQDDEASQMAYALALAEWGDVGGYDAEVRWDMITTAVFAAPFHQVQHRRVSTLSGGEQKRLALECLLRGSADVLLLDEPDNYLDVPSKRRLEQELCQSAKTVLFISHDRELLRATATSLVTLEGHGVWVHGGGFDSYDQARADRVERLNELHRRWSEEHDRLAESVRVLGERAKISAASAAKYRAMQTQLGRFETDGPPTERAVEQNVRMRLPGGRTSRRAAVCRDLELTALTQPFDLDIDYGDRVAVLGQNGTGKSHLLRLLAAGGSDQMFYHIAEHGEPVSHGGQARLGPTIRPGYFAQTHDRPDLALHSLVDMLHRGDDQREGLDRGAALSVLRRYELHTQADQRFAELSGGQQARFQVLLLELSHATMLLLDEPTDNLDLHSAEVLQRAVENFDGVVVAVTHDRWFARSFSRFIIIDAQGRVRETDEPVWDVGDVSRSPQPRPIRSGSVR